MGLFDQINQFGDITVFKNVKLGIQLIKTGDNTLPALYEEEKRLAEELLQELKLTAPQSAQKELRG